jgi:hypothetical protein
MSANLWRNMKLPKWNALKVHYPALDASVVFKNIGGKVELNYDIGVFSNACATRVSKAFNGVGGIHSIPFFQDIGPNGKLEAQVSSGKDMNWYIFRVRMLVKHLTSRYGEPEVFTPSWYKTKLNGRTGIIVFEVTGWSDATGHADLWDGAKCLWKGYGGLANKVMFWEASK